MNRSFTHTLAILFACATALSAQAIELKTYYAKANNKKAAELKTALYGIITNHTNVGYDGLLEAYKTTDRRADGYLRDWYSNATNFVIGGPAENKSYKKEGDAYNREHTVPQSWFGNTSLMKSDLVQVVPTDGYVNNMRSNHPLGENDGKNFTSKNGYSKVGACTVSGYSGTCFEPNDEIKGDMARIYFYVLACYENAHPNWNGGNASQFFDGKKYPGLKDWAMKMLLRWAKLDPVDDVERARNEAVYAIQKNRNPFVDFPSLCEYVWGDSVSYAFDVSLPHGQSDVVIPDNPIGPDDPDNPDNPDNPVNPDNPDAQSGKVEFSQCDWTSSTHPTYNTGYSTTINGLTISYYKASSTTTPVAVSNYGHLRFYDKSVMIIEGAEVVKVVFHAADSKVGSMVIGDQTIPFIDGELTWEGSMNPFVAVAVNQSRIASVDITIRETIPEPEPEPEPDWSLTYCNSVQGLNQGELKTALHNLIQPRQVLSYGGGEGYTWSGFASTDVMSDGSVRDRYSNTRREFNGLKSVAGMNIEHIWANSWWGHTMNNAYCDLFNLYPADAEANQRKNNNPIGVVDGTVSYDNGVSKVGKSSSYSDDQLITAWEPADEWKGDFARTYFYMATTYQNMTDEWTTKEGLLTVDPTSWTTMRPWVYELMLSWATNDPVDDIERDRNEAIYEIQGNRNPYVDYPELADYVWGARNKEAFYIDPTSTDPEIFVPVQNPGIDFGLQALTLGMNRRVMVRGRNLPAGLTATIEGEGFSMADSYLTSAEVATGTPLTITSTATAGGVYEATLVLRSGDYYEQRTPLTMTVVDGVPAYPARDITCSVYKRAFTATWMNMPLSLDEYYTIDVYTKTSDGSRKSLTGYPKELTDTFCIVNNPAALTTYYYEIKTSGGVTSLTSNEVQVDMPAIKPVFTSSASEMMFTSTPGAPSQTQSVKLNVQGISGFTVMVSCPAPFEISLDGETWSNELALTASQLEFQVRFGSVYKEGAYENEMTILLPEVKEIVVSLAASVDATKSFFESFEQGAKNSYTESSVACNAATWKLVNALIAADQNRNDGKSVRMKIGGSITMEDDKLGGCDFLWFYAGLYNQDTGVQLTVSYSLNGGQSWVPVVNELSFNKGEWKRYGYKIECEGLIRLKFETQAGNQNKRINIDDIQMSNYGTSDGLNDIEWTFSTEDIAVYTLDGRYIGSAIPARRGIYIVRQGNQVRKVKN